jgi:hypothetical protein
LTRFSFSLPQNEPYITSNIALGGVEYEMHLDWSYNGGYYRVRLIDESGDLPLMGKGLNPGVDLLETLKLGIGKLYLEGAQPTLANLSLDNRLVYEPVQETVSN